MKQEIPLSARNALARQAAAGEHPSADLLSAFVERALSTGESERVTSHLAACADCREIVFLASAAAGPEERAAAAQKDAPIAPPPRLRWARWKWLAPALAALLIVTGITIARLVSRTHPDTQQIAAVNRPLMPNHVQLAGAEPEIKQPHPEPRAKRTAPQPSLPANEKSSRALSLPPQGSPGGNDLTPATPAEGPSPAASAPPPQQAPGLSGGAPAALNAAAKPAPAPSQFQAHPAQPTGKVSAGQVSDAATLGANAQVQQPILTANAEAPKKQFESVQMQRAAMPPVHWRITSDGHLERSTIPGDWTRALGEQPVSFRAVAVIGDQVWAGGNDGALFHSIDGGNQWTKIALDANGQPERGAVNAIQFDTASQGRVTIDSGTIWKTSDGGKNWSKQ